MSAMMIITQPIITTMLQLTTTPPLLPAVHHQNNKRSPKRVREAERDGSGRDKLSVRVFNVIIIMILGQHKNPLSGPSEYAACHHHQRGSMYMLLYKVTPTLRPPPQPTTPSSTSESLLSHVVHSVIVKVLPFL